MSCMAKLRLFLVLLIVMKSTDFINNTRFQRNSNLNQVLNDAWGQVGEDSVDTDLDNIIRYREDVETEVEDVWGLKSCLKRKETKLDKI